MWTRQRTAKMGLDEKEFIKVFLTALANDDVIGKLRDAVCNPIQQEVNELRNLIKLKDAKINELESKVSQLELQVDDLEQYSRRNSLRFNGIAESETEDVTSKVIDVINNTLEVEPPVTPSDIDRLHRSGKRLPGKPRAILVKFTSYRTRDKVIRNRGKLRPSKPIDTSSASSIRHAPKQTIFVNEDLTMYRSDLLYQARQRKKKDEISDCWSWDGRILIKDKKSKIFNIRTMADLNTLVAASS